jgi:hypothetical protein
VDEDLASKILAEEELEIEVDLGLGGGFEARYYTCDFSYDYVRYSIHVEVCLQLACSKRCWGWGCGWGWGWGCRCPEPDHRRTLADCHSWIGD